MIPSHIDYADVQGSESEITIIIVVTYLIQNQCPALAVVERGRFWKLFCLAISRSTGYKREQRARIARSTKSNENRNLF